MKISRKWIYAATTSSALLLSGFATSASSLPVIPDAKGFGIETPAGRGGTIYKVTNLSASGDGSLRNCVEQSGPRVCVFEVGGTITLSEDLYVKSPNLTIAGQTAPSPGITLRGASLSVHADDVLVQHIRVRPGGSPDGPDPQTRSGIRVSQAGNIVFDHVSVSWSIDQLASVWRGAGDVTFLNSMFYEPLEDSLHPAGPHAFGPLLYGEEDTRVAMIGNLIAHSKARNVRSATANLYFANNVVYNWQNRGTELFGKGEFPTNNSLIGNIYKAGTNTRSSSGIVIEPNSGSSLKMVQGSRVYVEDNRGPGYDSGNPWSVVDNRAGGWVQASSAPVTVPGFEPMDSNRVEAHVLANVGARPADRDHHDARAIKTVQNNTGRIIDSVTDVGGWKDSGLVSRPLDVPARPHDDDDGDGYTNLEEWLHSHAQSVEGTLPAPAAPTNLTVE